MGLSVPTSLASIAATLALGGGAAAPYEPLPPPLSKSSPAEKPAPPAKPPEFPAPKPDASGYQPYQPLPPPLPKASPRAKPAAPPAKPATPPAPSAGAKPYQPLPSVQAPAKGAAAAKPIARAKAGTATKITLNIISTTAYVLLGKTYGGLMVDVRPTNAKLRARATRIVRMLSGLDEKAAASVSTPYARRKTIASATNS